MHVEGPIRATDITKKYNTRKPDSGVHSDIYFYCLTVGAHPLRGYPELPLQDESSPNTTIKKMTLLR